MKTELAKLIHNLAYEESFSVGINIYGDEAEIIVDNPVFVCELIIKNAEQFTKYSVEDARHDSQISDEAKYPDLCLDYKYDGLKWTIY